jgi:hypothetical protein
MTQVSSNAIVFLVVASAALTLRVAASAAFAWCADFLAED